MNISWQNINRNTLLLVFSGGIIILLLMYALLRDGSDTVSLAEATQLIESGSVHEAVYDDHYIYLSTSSKGMVKIQGNLLPHELSYRLKMEPKKHYGWLVFFVIVVGISGGIGWVYRDRLKFDLPQRETVVVKSAEQSAEEVNNSSILAVKSNVRFSDIGGINDVKEELEEIIDFLRNPKRYYNFGARMPRGVLLVGPPGVGKTMIAKAVAAEADVPFFYQSGASFVQIYVGMGAKRVHELFAAAKKNAPAIIFIDEIDAVGKKREGGRNDEREGTLNQLLTEMDGFEETSGIVVIAATNNIEVMDSALLRAGRFDRRIFVELPTANERHSILEKYLRAIPHDLSVEELAKMTVGFNGASLAALVNEAALLCLRQREIQVKMEHFLSVKDKVMFGKKKITILSQRQRAYQSRYHAGKTFAATWFDLPYEKISLSNDTITPPVAEPLLKHEIEAQVRVHLAGVAACDLTFGEHASNASNDVAMARELVRSMIVDYGMGKTLTVSAEEQETTLHRLYEEIKTLLQQNKSSVDKLEGILAEYEQISKSLAKATMSDVL